MALLLKDEFAELDMEKVIRMCIIHDLGEAFTGDIPAFYKTDADTQKEDSALQKWVAELPDPVNTEFAELLAEMDAQKTQEAKFYKALDNLEAVIQHDEADISTWIPLEYEFQFTYGKERVQFSPYLQELKKEIDKRAKEKIDSGK